MGISFTRREFLGTASATAAGLAAALRGADAAPVRTAPPAVSLSVFSKHLQYLDYRALAETIAEAGFDGIDLTVRDGGHVLPARVGDDLPKAVEAARAAGIGVPMMTTTIVSARDPHAEAVLATASGLGIRDYRLGWVPYDRAKGITGTFDALRPQFRELASLHESLGIRGAYQNHAGDRFGCAVWDLWMVLKDVNSRWLGCQYDIRHAVIEGMNSWPNALRAIAPHIHTIDIKDGHWERTPKGWQPVTVPLGDGAVDLLKFLKELRALGVAKPVSVHFEYPFPETGTPAERRKAAVALMRKDRERLRAAMAEAGWGTEP
jgi:sugar phosphate isomerase/epimerase